MPQGRKYHFVKYGDFLHFWEYFCIIGGIFELFEGFFVIFGISLYHFFRIFVFLASFLFYPLKTMILFEIIKLTYLDRNIKIMDEKKVNHIETSSRASSAANFNSIDIDLRSNYNLSISNFGFDTKISNTEGFIKVKSAKTTKKEKSIKVKKKDILSEELITENINPSTESSSTQSQDIYSIPLSNDIKKSSLNQKDNNTEANYSKNLNEEPRISERNKKIKKLVIPGIMFSSLVLVIGIILGLIAAFGGNFL
jgi:hypothetical protein